MSDGQKVNGKTADCATFQEELPSLFENGGGEDVLAHAHLKTCENCRNLVQELQYIAQQAKILLPLHDPAPQVWENIQSAIKKEPSRVK